MIDASASTIAIDDPDDPRIAGYRSIRERDLRGRDGLFVAEGTVVLDALLRSRGFSPVSVLVLANRIDGIARLLSSVPADVPVYRAEGPVMDAIAGFPMHRGVLALARRTRVHGPETLLARACEAASSSGRPARALVGIGLANHDNVGSLLRCAAAFDARPVLFDAGSADPLYRKAIRTSAGAALTHPHHRGGSADALLDAVEGAGLVPLALSPAGAEDVRDIARGEPIALIVGAEGPGLPDAVLGRVRTARIAMAPGHDSLNVAVAAAVALHALQPR